MNSPWFLVLLGLLYVVLGGGLSLLRREGLSVQFALEAVVITGLFSGAALFLNLNVHPALFLALIYLVTMRVRLLADLGTYYARRGNFERAEQIYRLAERLFPNQADCLLVNVNRGAAQLQQGKLDEALALFEGVLKKHGEGYLGLKNEAASHYNLGVVYRRKQLEAKALAEFDKVIEIWPMSAYARHAEAAKRKPAKPASP
jgi:tetratricopeptide (TPR) repeat protein